MCGVLTLVVAGNAALNGTLALGEGGSAYRDMFAPAGLVDREVASMPAQLALDLDREEWQRLDQDYANNPNASMILDYAGVASYFSTSNGTTARFLSDLELPLHNKVLFPDLDSRTFLDALLSTRYWAGAESGGRSVPYGFEQILTENGTGVWEDGSVLPLGYTYDTVISQEVWDGLNGLEKQEMMMRAVTAEGLSSTGQPPQTTVTQVEILSVTGEGADWDGSELNAWEGGSTLTITFQGLPDSETYLRLNGAQLAWTDASQYPVVVQAGDMTHTCTFTSQNFLWHSGQSSTSINLGYSQEGLTQVTLTFPEAGGFRMEDLEIWCQPMGSYDQWRDDLARESLTDVQVETDRITGSLSTSGPRVLCFAIPYSQGWSVYVDGEQVPTLKANDFLLAAEVDGGEHQVELRYHSPGFRPGLVLAGAGLAGIALLVLRNRRDRQHSTQREANTDG